MKMVCFCEKVHFRFIYPSLIKLTAVYPHAKARRRQVFIKLRKQEC